MVGTNLILNWRTLVILVCLPFFCRQTVVSQNVSGIKVPAGFEVTQVAGDELATNVYCMAVSPEGETFVSGPGYIKVLLDSNDDGVFDDSRMFADGPKSGAQGICFDGSDLLCTGDGGLLRFSDDDGDGKSDGKPEKLFSIKTGGEHDAHAIRKGPDGWWYLLAGNGVPIVAEYVAGKSSPVKTPRAGFLMRISPDWREKEIFAHGFRNAYDFDFNSLGQVFVYDSDGERDVTLPWYRPTRLYQMRPGDDAGWVAAGWKRPSYFFDMPVEVGALGRGSPTGVVVNRGHRFPISFDDAIFVADWTFGRVIAFRRDPKTQQYDRGTDFAIADGQFGFAVTDLDFSKDGSLLISVGGRGTQGAIYRVQHKMERVKDSKKVKLSPRQDFILHVKSNRMSVDELIGFLKVDDERVQSAILEAMVGRRDIVGRESNLDENQQRSLAEGLHQAGLSSDPKVLGLIWRIARELGADVVEQIELNNLSIETKLIFQLANARDEVSRRELVSVVAQELGKTEGDLAVLARIGQLALGGCGAENAKQMFVGHTAASPLKFSEPKSNALTTDLTFALEQGLEMSRKRPQLSNGCDEIGRLAGMLRCRSVKLQEAMSKFIGQESGSVSRDIHWLNCISQTSSDSGEGLSPAVTSRLAQCVAGLGQRIKRDELNIDRNFYPRMKTLVKQLFQMDDGELANQVAPLISGDGDEAYLYEALPPAARKIAMSRFAASVEQNVDEATAAQIRILAKHDTEDYIPLIRKFGSRPDLRDVVLGSLAKFALPEDQELFVAGLRSADLETVKNSAAALRRLPASSDQAEVFYALLASRRMGWGKPSVRVRDELVALLQTRTGQNFGYQPKRNGLNQNDVLQGWSFWLQKEYPKQFEMAFASPDTRAFTKRMETVDWESGNADRGKQLYKTLQCAQCHDGGTRLGPRLEGISKRFSRDDLFQSIVTPNQQIPDRYRALVIETVDGLLYRGSMVYESVDGITLQDTGGQTVRINRDDIEERTLSEKSLMPEGLLNEATDQDWSDLYAYLRSL